jgi:hypothetical protein
MPTAVQVKRLTANQNQAISLGNDEKGNEWGMPAQFNLIIITHSQAAFLLNKKIFLYFLR